MRSHETDWTSLIAGLTFLAIGVTYLVATTTHGTIDSRWMVATVLVGLGGAGLGSTIKHARRRTGD